MSVQPRLIEKSHADRGTVRILADLTRRIKRIEANLNNLPAGSISGGQIASGSINTAEIAAGAITAQTIAAGAVTAAAINVTYLSDISANIGTVTAGTVTGATIQTSNNASVNKVIMDSSGLRAYDAIGGTPTISIDTSGALTMNKGSITLASTPNPGTGARIVLDSTGIKGYNASNQNLITVDATTGIITATGVFNAQTGSQVPTATITGDMPGGANRYSNSAFQDNLGNFSANSWTQSVGTSPPINGLTNGGAPVPPVWGSLVGQLVSAGYLSPSTAPAVVAQPGAGLAIGTYRYTFTFVTSTGETAPSPEATVTTSSGNQQTLVPLPAAGSIHDPVIGRNVYRTAVGGASGTEKLVAFVAGTSVANYVDSTPDTSLGAAQPTANTSIQRVGIAYGTGPLTRTQVVPGLNYTFSHYVWPVTTARNNAFYIQWFDSSQTLISTVTSPGVAVTRGQWNRPSYTVQAPANAAYVTCAHYVAYPGAPAGETYYIECMQMEQGDRVSAWAPLASEILVPSLSAISANLGTITAGTITSATVQSNASVTTSGGSILDGYGFRHYTSSGTLAVSLSGSGAIITGTINALGLTFPSNNLAATSWTMSQANQNALGWLYSGASQYDAAIFAGRTNVLTGAYDTSELEIFATSPDGLANQSAITLQATSGSSGGGYAGIYLNVNRDGGAQLSQTLLDADGASDFLQWKNNLSEVNPLTSLMNLNVAWGIVQTGSTTVVDAGSGNWSVMGTATGSVQIHLGTTYCYTFCCRSGAPNQGNAQTITVQASKGINPVFNSWSAGNLASDYQIAFIAIHD